jgi:hypothetical protein
MTGEPCRGAGRDVEAEAASEWAGSSQSETQAWMMLGHISSKVFDLWLVMSKRGEGSLEWREDVSV